MVAHYLTFCEQTHPDCREYCDDHIHTTTYMVQATPEEASEIEGLVAKIEKASEAERDELTEFQEENPEDYEEGEIFVGCRWVEHTTANNSGSDDITTGEVIQMLRDLLAEFE